MKFDSNQAWKQAAAQVSANRDVLIALSGVFFLLPVLAFSLFLPQPTPPAGMAGDAMVAFARNYYAKALPFAIPLLLMQAFGTLAMLTLFTDRRRPTVGESLRRSLSGILPYAAAQLLLGLGIVLVAGVIGGIAGLTGSSPVVVVALVAIFLAAAYLAIRTSLIGPVIVVEQVRNPLKALSRSWRITGGNSIRVGLFYLLVGLAFFVVITVVMAIVGIIMALLASPGVARTIAALISAALGATMSAYLVAILAAVYRQLAGGSAEREPISFG